jgi:hypothetical protein
MIFRMLFVGLIMTTFSCFSSPGNINNEGSTNPPSKNELIGTWQICTADNLVDNNLHGQKDVTQYKVITDETFTVLMIQKGMNLFSSVFTGTYTVKDGIYTENIQYSAPALKESVGSKNTFTSEIKNGFWITKGINNPYNQVWKKIKN